MSTENNLRRIKPSADHFQLSHEMLEDDNPVEGLEANLETDCELIQPAVNLSDADSIVAEAMESFKAGDTSMDRMMAVRLHRALPITRRVASDQRVWHFLGLLKYPEFVCHRWLKRPGADGVKRRAAERFLGDRVRNTFARLWWACELTVDDDDYSLTEKLLSTSGFQDNYEAFFGRAFSAYPPAMKAFIEVMSDKPEGVVRKTAKEFGHVLTTQLLESLDIGQLKSLVEGLAAESSGAKRP